MEHHSECVKKLCYVCGDVVKWQIQSGVHGVHGPPLWDQPDPFLDHLPWASDGCQSSVYFQRSYFRAIESLYIVSSCLFIVEKSLQLAASWLPLKEVGVADQSGHGCNFSLDFDPLFIISGSATGNKTESNIQM